MKNLAFAAVAAFAPVAFAAPASAITVLNANDNGWYNNSGSHQASNNNTIIGFCCGDQEYRSFYAFDLSSLAGQTIVSATIPFASGNGS